MARLYGWLEGDRGLAKTKPSNKHLKVTIAYERDKQDWRTLADNEVVINFLYDEGKLKYWITCPEDVEEVEALNPEDIEAV